MDTNKGYLHDTSEGEPIQIAYINIGDTTMNQAPAILDLSQYMETMRNSDDTEQVTETLMIGDFPVSERPYSYEYNNLECQCSEILNWIPYNRLVEMSKPDEPRCLDIPSRNDYYDKMSVITGEWIKPCVMIDYVVAVNPDIFNRFEKLIVAYRVGGNQLNAITTYDQFEERKLLPLFWGIKAKGNQKKKANESLYNLICMAKWYFVTIPQIPGWIFIDYQLSSWYKQKLLYVTENAFPARLGIEIPPAIKNRKCKNNDSVLEVAISHYASMMPSNPKLRVLTAFRLASQFLTLFSMKRVELDSMLVLEPSKTINSEYLVALMKTMDDTLHTLSFTSDKSGILEELNHVNDGTVIIRDTNPRIEGKNMEKVRSCILNDFQSWNGRNDRIHVRHLLTLISLNAVDWLSDENAVYISFDESDIPLPFSPFVYLDLMREFDNAVIKCIQKQTGWFKQSFDALIKRVINKTPEEVPRLRRNTYILIETTMQLVNLIFSREVFSLVDSQYFITLLSPNNVMELSELIKTEFLSALNRCVREKMITIVNRKQSRIFSENSNQVIAMDNILGIEPATIENTIIPMMNRRVNQKQLIKILAQENVLYRPEKNHHNNRHTISMESKLGDAIDVHVYSIDRNMLDIDVRQYTDNMAYSDFLFKKEEIPEKEFIPLIQCNQLLVGSLMRYEDEEDQHVCISGQSSCGKSYALAQRAAFLSGLQHKVVMFDAEGAFTKKKLQRMLPSDYIEKRICFYSMETMGIPINLFHMDGKHKSHDKSTLEGVLTAGCSKLPGSQVDLLRKMIHEILNDASSNCIDLKQIREALKKHTNSNDRIRTYLEPILDDLEMMQMSDNTWDTFFDDVHNLYVISADPVFKQNGSHIFDMLIASLYNYQVQNYEQALDIIIDEIQNQNVSSAGPLWKIVTGGRKFHMYISCATQEYITSRNDRLGLLMGKFRNKIFMSPTSDSETAVAVALDYGNKKKRVFDAMGRGDCIMKMPCYSKAIGQNHYITISGHILSYEEWLNWKE